MDSKPVIIPQVRPANIMMIARKAEFGVVWLELMISEPTIMPTERIPKKAAKM